MGATLKQRREAATCFPDGPRRCFRWEDVYRSLETIAGQSPLVREFLDFLKEHDLSPGNPLTVGQMTAFLQSAGFLKTLDRLARLLKENYTWDVVPARYSGRYVEDRWGRVALCFDAPDWRPGLVLGFLYSTHDHQVAFVDQKRGIDLFLRIGALPKDTRNTKAIQPVLDVLGRKREALGQLAGSVLLLGERGNGSNRLVAK